MPSLKTIRKRINSVRSTQKITKAMKMVAAAKLRRANQAAVQARDYLKAAEEITTRVIANRGNEKNSLTIAKENITKRDYLILTSDRGLCGGFNSNLLRRVEGELVKCRELKIRTECRIIGKKGRDYFKAKHLEIAESATGLYENLDFKVAQELGKVAIHRFEVGKTEEVWIGFNYFKSMMVQEVRIQKLLPFDDVHSPVIDYIYEPNGFVVLDKVLKEYVTAQIYSALLESYASELAARMAAMDNATNNASDMIQYLTLVYNRARQATITRELMDIVNGAEALR